VVALALLLTACSSGHRVPTAKVRPAPPTTADPYAVPAVIDVAYVNRVLAALDQVNGNATREAVRAKALTPEFMADLRAVYEGVALEQELKVWSITAQRAFAGFSAAPGNRRTTVIALTTATPACVFVKTHRDYSAATPSPGPDLPHYITLRPAARHDTRNPTPWLVTVDVVTPDGGIPENACAT